MRNRNLTSIDASHVLSAIGLSELEAFSSQRFGVSKFNTKQQLPQVIELVKQVTKNFRVWS